MSTYPVPRLFFWWHRSITIWWPWRSEPRIYVPRSRSTDEIPVTIAHESVHVAQWLKLGRLGFMLRYITPRGRMELEAEAFAASVRYWKAISVTTDAGGTPMLDVYAHALATEYGELAEDDAREAIARWLLA